MFIKYCLFIFILLQDRRHSRSGFTEQTVSGQALKENTAPVRYDSLPHYSLRHPRALCKSVKMRFILKTLKARFARKLKGQAEKVASEPRGLVLSLSKHLRE